MVVARTGWPSIPMIHHETLYDAIFALQGRLLLQNITSFQVNSQTKEDNIKKINGLSIETTACIN